MSTRVVTDKVRLSFPHIFEPYAFGDEEPRYSVMVLIPKSDKKTLKALRDAEQEARKNGISSVFGGKDPGDKLASVIKDGDLVADEYPEREGHWYLTARTKTRPGVVDINVNPILDASEVYSGCYARVSLSAFPYKYGGNFGVSFGLGNVQKVADGENLGGAKSAEADFAEFKNAPSSSSDLI
jgi:hypothetical protein